MSAREGLFAPAFCALIVRSVRSVPIGGATVVACSFASVVGSPCGVVSVSVYVGLMGGDGSVRFLFCRVDIPGVVWGCEPGEDVGSSSE